MTMLRLIPFSLMSRVCLPEPMGASPGFFRTLRVQLVVHERFALKTKPGLAPNGTHFDCDSSDSLGLLGFLRF
jgi:hypothetical protein